MLGFFGSPPPPPPVEKSFFSEHSHLTAFAFGALVMLVVVLLFYMGVKNELHEQLRSLDEEKARIELTGGYLHINSRGEHHAIFMTGPAQHIFDGEVYC